MAEEGKLNAWLKFGRLVCSKAISLIGGSTLIIYLQSLSSKLIGATELNNTNL